jgi:hypothetical protein
VADYTRAIDFDAKWSREDYTRRQGKYPLLGRPPMPDEHVTAILSGNYAADFGNRCVSGRKDASIGRRPLYDNSDPTA